MHLERQVDPVTLEVTLFARVYESMNFLALSLSHVSRTLVDIHVRVLSWLTIAFLG